MHLERVLALDHLRGGLLMRDALDIELDPRVGLCVDVSKGHTHGGELERAMGRGCSHGGQGGRRAHVCILFIDEQPLEFGQEPGIRDFFWPLWKARGVVVT